MALGVRAANAKYHVIHVKTILPNSCACEAYTSVSFLYSVHSSKCALLIDYSPLLPYNSQCHRKYCKNRSGNLQNCVLIAAYSVNSHL